MTIEQTILDSKKHTLGPWRVNDISADLGMRNGWPFGAEIMREAECENGIAQVATALGMTSAECEANARLIASAPELLAALQGSISHDNALKPEYRLSPSLRRQIEAALARVEGRGK